MEIHIPDTGKMVYTDKTDGTRTFDANTDEIELKWHRDEEDRTIHVVGNTDWKIQLENQLPRDIDGVFIPKLSWHRLIKGSNDLIIRIND